MGVFVIVEVFVMKSQITQGETKKTKSSMILLVLIAFVVFSTVFFTTLSLLCLADSSNSNSNSNIITSIDNKEITSGQSMVLNDGTRDLYFNFLITVDNRLLVREFLDNKQVVVSSGKCGSIGSIKFCVESIDYYDNKAVINLTVREDRIRLTRVFNTTTVRVGDKIKVNVVLNNTGVKKSYEYTDDYNKGFRINTSESLFKSNGFIEENETLNLTYEITALKQGTYKPIGLLKYYNPNYKRIIESYAKEEEINVLPSLEIKDANSGSNGNSNHGLNTSFEFSFNITNHRCSMINVSVIIPYGLVFESNDYHAISKVEETSEGLSINYSSIKVCNKTEVFTIKMTGVMSGNKQVVIKARNDVENTTLFSWVNITKPNVSITIYNLPSQMESLEERTISILLYNPTKVWLGKIKCNITMFNVTTTRYLDFLPPGSTRVVFKEKIKADSVSSETKRSYKIIVNATSLGEKFGENFTFEKTGSITITPLKDVSIVHSIPTSVYSGEELNISVYVKNNRNYETRVFGNDTISCVGNDSSTTKYCSRILIVGTRTNSIVIDAGEKELIYSYILKFPETKEEKRVNVKTRIEYNLPQLNTTNKVVSVEKTTSIRVLPKTNSVTLNTSYDKSSVGLINNLTIRVWNNGLREARNISVVFKGESVDVNKNSLFIKKLSSKDYKEERVLFIMKNTSGVLNSRILWWDDLGDKHEVNKSIKLYAYENKNIRFLCCEYNAGSKTLKLWVCKKPGTKPNTTTNVGITNFNVIVNKKRFVVKEDSPIKTQIEDINQTTIKYSYYGIEFYTWANIINKTSNNNIYSSNTSNKGEKEEEEKEKEIEKEQENKGTGEEGKKGIEEEEKRGGEKGVVKEKVKKGFFDLLKSFLNMIIKPFFRIRR